MVAHAQITLFNGFYRIYYFGLPNLQTLKLWFKFLKSVQRIMLKDLFFTGDRYFEGVDHHEQGRANEVL